MSEIGMIAPATGALGLFFAFITYFGLTKKSAGTDKMIAIGDEIHTGAMTFLKAQYSKLSVFVVIVAYVYE